MTQITIGADPEFFLKKGNMNISAHDLVPGTKDNPFILDCGAVQADGTAVEFNIDPASSAKEFRKNIETVLKQVRDIVPEEFKFNFKPTVTYNREYFRDVIPGYSKELGCDPDMDAKTFQENPAPKQIGTMRTAGGHIHIGWTKDADVKCPHHLYDCKMICRFIDECMMNMIKHLEPKNKRKGMYGKGIAMRPKPYGVEYRSPSNFWLNYPELWEWMFEFIQWGINEMQQGQVLSWYMFRELCEYKGNWDGYEYKLVDYSNQKDVDQIQKDSKIHYNFSKMFPKPPVIKGV